MAILWMDGLDNYGTVRDLISSYHDHHQSQNVYRPTGGRFGGGAIGVVMDFNNLSWHLSQFVGFKSEIIVAFAWKSPFWNTWTNSGIIAFPSNGEINSTTVFALDIQANASLVARRGGTGVGAIIGQSTKLVQRDRWYWVEIRYRPSQTNGLVEVRMDGETWISFSGGNTTIQPGGVSTDVVGFIRWAGLGGIDDLIIMDLEGPAPFNNFLGDCQITTYEPDATVSSELTPINAPTNHAALAGIYSDHDFTHVRGRNGSDVYSFQDLPADPEIEVKAVMVTAVARKDDVGARRIDLGVVDGANESMKGSVPLSSNYHRYHYLLSTRPDGSPWTPASFNALQAKLTVTP